MRPEICVALAASAAFHAGLLLLTPADGSRSAGGPVAEAAPVITVYLKNALAPGDAAPEPVRLRSARFLAAQPAALLIGRPARAGGGQTRRTRVADARRFYPREAIERGLEGEAIVMLRLGDDGRLIDAEIARSSGHEILDHAALRAVRAALRFKPGSREILLPVTFALH